MRAILLALACACAFSACAADERTYCLPTQTCWPSQKTISQLEAGLSGDLLQPDDPLKDANYSDPGSAYYWATVGLMKNQRFLSKPGIIVVVANDDDVKTCINFARTYNIRLTVISSGHDYIGRNTAYGSLQINLYNLRSVEVNLTDTEHSDGGTALLGVGNNFAKLYEEMSELHNRVILGGASPEVSLGGYTLGGGHSPITRMKGLAVDNVIELHMVTADGATVQVYEGGYTLTDPSGNVSKHDDPDLFWALRGGGGGTFGIVTRIKFKLHLPPDQFQTLSCSWGFGYQDDVRGGKEFLPFYGQFIQTLPHSWGGYLMFAPPFTAVQPGLPFGYISLFLIHWGNYSEAVETSDPLYKWHPEWAIDKYHPCKMSNYSTYWDFAKTMNDTVHARQYIFSASVQPETWNTLFTDDLVEAMKSASKKSVLTMGTATLVGGRAREFPDNSSSVVSGFRSADLALTMGTSLAWPELDGYIMGVSKLVSGTLYKYMDHGYVNEPDSQKEDWKAFYWGDKYDGLLRVKQQWDPNHVFTCLHCVGSDLV